MEGPCLDASTGTIGVRLAGCATRAKASTAWVRPAKTNPVAVIAGGSITLAPWRNVMGVPGQRSQLRGSECNLIVLHAGDVLHDAFAVRCPGIDAEGEVSSRRGHFLWPACP